MPLSYGRPFAFSISIYKLQVMQDAALRTATGVTQDTNMQHLDDETLILLMYEHLQLHALQFRQKAQHSSHLLHKHTTYFTTPWLKPTILFSTHSLDPCLWWESDHPAFGPPASLSLHLASSSITPTGYVHKSRGDSVLCMWVQLKRWGVGVADGA